MRFLIVLPLVAALCACDSGSSGDKPKTDGGGAKTDGGKTDTGKTDTGKVDAPKGFVYDMWAAWNSFGEGSSVTLETVSDFGGNKSTMKTTTTIKKKEADKITVEDVMEMAGNKMPATSREIKKPGSTPVEGNCPVCGKAFKDHKDESKWSEESCKAGDKELKCNVMEAAAKNCKGEDNPTKMKAWYSKDVPGWTVKMWTKMAQGESTQTCVAFEKK